MNSAPVYSHRGTVFERFPFFIASLSEVESTPSYPQLELALLTFFVLSLRQILFSLTR